MRLGKLRNTEIECSPFVLLPILYALLAGRPGTMLLNLLALFLHELCHAFVARAMGYRIKRIELQPFGFVARIEKRIGNRWDELAVASAGPLFSLVSAAACGALWASESLHLPGRTLIAQFGRINALLGIINLVPALPLDGGRMAESLLRMVLPSRQASQLLLFLGSITGAAAIVGGIFVPTEVDMQTMMFIMGAFLLLAVWRESRQTKEARIDGVLRRFETIRAGDCLRVRFIALHQSVRGEDALRFTDPRNITYILVVNDAMEEIGRLSESCLLDGIARLGMGATLRAILLLH